MPEPHTKHLSAAFRKLFGQKLWKPIEMEYPASWSIDSKEDDFELMQAGINATAIDYAKFGRLFLNGGKWNGKQVVSANWIVDSTKAQSDGVPWRANAYWKQMGGWYGYLCRYVRISNAG